MTRHPADGSVIPPEWVGLAPEDGPSPETTPPAAPPGTPAGRGTPHREVIGSVLASLSPAVIELVTPVAAETERGGCFIEPGRPCRGSGRCRQRGY